MTNATEILNAAAQSIDGWIQPESLAQKIERGAPFREIGDQLCNMIGAEAPEEIKAGLSGDIWKLNKHIPYLYDVAAKWNTMEEYWSVEIWDADGEKYNAASENMGRALLASIIRYHAQKFVEA